MEGDNEKIANSLLVLLQKERTPEDEYRFYRNLSQIFAIKALLAVDILEQGLEWCDSGRAELFDLLLSDCFEIPDTARLREEVNKHTVNTVNEEL